LGGNLTEELWNLLLEKEVIFGLPHLGLGNLLLVIELLELLLLEVLESLLFFQHLLAFQEPLGLALDLGLWQLESGPAEVHLVFAGLKLLFIHGDVCFVELAHLLDLIEVHHEALLIGVVFLDALPAEDRVVIGAVEVLHPVVVTFADQTLDALLVLEVDVSQNGVSLHDLIQDIEVEGQLVHRLDLLDQFATDGASDSEVVVEGVQTFSAEGVATVHQYPRDALAHVELQSAVVAVVQASGVVISLHHVLQGLLQLLVSFLAQDLVVLVSPLSESLDSSSAVGAESVLPGA
jgi:hypothetical protein